MSTTESPDRAGGPGSGRVATYIRTHTNPPVFFISAAVILLFLLGGVFFTDAVSTGANDVLSFIANELGWFYIVSATFFLVFVIAAMVSRFGRVKLGPDGSEPEYKPFSWFAMLFTAGMGIGLVFYGVYEPAYHAANAPKQGGAGDGQLGAATEGTNWTLFHWGLHPWAIYIVLGLAMGYFCFRKGLPLRPASALYPLLGIRIYGWPGNLVDILAVFGTLFGLATSLGLGTMQINTGLTELFGIANNNLTQTLIITAITAVAVTSVMFGINKGIRRLSNLNLWLAFILMAFVFAFGPKAFILSGLADNLGYYLQNLVNTSLTVFNPAMQPEAAAWQADWTLFYWGWWISWSPFVGMFIARISYGRTVRQFIAGALFLPVGASIVWFTIMGGSGLFYEMFGTADISGQSADLALFTLMNQLPVGGIVAAIASLLAIVVVVLFFATSSDSGSLVVDMLTNGGDPHPIRLQRFFWAVTEGLVTVVLLIVGGETALTALQAASITTGLPFAIVLLLICWALLRVWREETALQRRGGSVPTGDAVASAGSTPDEHTTEPVPTGAHAQTDPTT